jgi:hypothetical protein
VAWSVTIKAGLKNVVLPNGQGKGAGKRYQAGDVAVLSDEQITLLSKTAIASLFTAAPVLITATWPAGGV